MLPRAKGTLGQPVQVSAKTPTIRLIDQFLNVTIKAIAQHPAIIRLMDAPRSANPAADIKQSLREQLVELFLTQKPRMSRSGASPDIGKDFRILALSEIRAVAGLLKAAAEVFP